MAKIDLRKTVYNKDQFSRVVGGREFTTFGIAQEAPFSIEDFFNQYENLFLTIPVFGDNNTHEYLVRRSSELVGFQRTTEDIQPLLDEIASLRDQLLTTRLDNVQLQISASGGGAAAGVSDQFTDILNALAQPIEFPDFSEFFPQSEESFGLIEDTISTSISSTGIPESREISVFANDQIPEGKILTFVGIDQDPTFGTARVINTQNGTIQYTPSSDARPGNKVDKITYKVRDEQNREDTGVIYVNITKLTPEVESLQANDDVIDVSIDADGNVNSNTVNILANDIDPDTGQPVFFDSITEEPLYGTVAILDSEVGIIRYTPNKVAPDGIHADQFEYKIFNRAGASAKGKVYVNIKNNFLVNPTPGDDEIGLTIRIENTENPNSNYTILNNKLNVLENDGGLDLVVRSVSQGEYGTVVNSGGGVVTYIPTIGVRSSGAIDLNVYTTPGAGVDPIVNDSFTYTAESLATNLTSTSPVNVRIAVILPDEQPILGDRTDPLGSGKKASGYADTDASGRPQEPDFRNEEEKDKKKSSGGSTSSAKTYNSTSETSSSTSGTTNTPSGESGGNPFNSSILIN